MKACSEVKNDKVSLYFAKCLLQIVKANYLALQFCSIKIQNLMPEAYYSGTYQKQFDQCIKSLKELKSAGEGDEKTLIDQISDLCLKLTSISGDQDLNNLTDLAQETFKKINVTRDFG